MLVDDAAVGMAQGDRDGVAAAHHDALDERLTAVVEAGHGRSLPGERSRVPPAASTRRDAALRRSDAYSGRCDSNSPSAATTPCARCSPWPAARATGCCPRAGSPTRWASPSGSCPRSSPTSSAPASSRRPRADPAATASRASGGRSACSRSSRRWRATAGARTCVLRGGPCGLDGTCDVHDVFFEGQEALRGTFARSTLAELATQHALGSRRAETARDLPRCADPHGGDR